MGSYQTESPTAAWLRQLHREAEMAAEAHAPLRGPVRREQRPWSHALDAIEAERQAAA